VEYGASGHGALWVGCPEFAISTTKKLPYSHCILAGLGTRKRVRAAVYGVGDA